MLSFAPCSGQAWSIRRPARRCLPPGAHHHPLHSLLRLHRHPQAGGAVHHLHHPGRHQVLPLWALRCYHPYHVSIPPSSMGSPLLLFLSCKHPTIPAPTRMHEGAACVFPFSRERRYFLAVVSGRFPEKAQKRG